jgi:hypothetical protein
MKSISRQYILGLTMGIFFIPLTSGLMRILPDLGWHFFTLMYALIFIFQVTCYYLTSEQKPQWAIVNFILNFIIWSTELVGIEKKFGETEFFSSELSVYYISVIAGLLWTTNKIAIDSIFGRISTIDRVKSRIDLKFEHG